MPRFCFLDIHLPIEVRVATDHLQMDCDGLVHLSVDDGRLWSCTPATNGHPHSSVQLQQSDDLSVVLLSLGFRLGPTAWLLPDWVIAMP